MKTLRKIFQELFIVHFPELLPDLAIEGIAIDSRAVKAGYLFVAMKGGSLDGHDFIAKAIEDGAVAVVGEKNISGLKVPYVRVENTRQALTWIAASFYDFPAAQADGDRRHRHGRQDHHLQSDLQNIIGGWNQSWFDLNRQCGHWQ